MRKTIAFMLIIAASLLLASPIVAQDRPKRILRPGPLETEEDITRFIFNVLNDRTKRNDPFVKYQDPGMRQASTYEVEEKPRPEFGFGRYDVETLTLMAIWQEKETVVSMVRSPDSKVFVIKVGDEAYDGRVVEINLTSGYVKFLQELKRTGGPARPGEPDVKYVEKIVRLRR